MNIIQKIALGLCGVSVAGFLQAATIDTKSAKVAFVGYKAPVMADLGGHFNQIQYTFGKDTKSLSGTLQNARAIITPTSAEIPDNEEATNNLNKVFFPTLLGKNNIQVTFIKIIEGEDKGIISAKVTIGKESSIVPLEYTIVDNSFVAKGVLDLHAFTNSTKALQALSAAAAGHAGISWPNVTLIFTANITQ